MRTPDEFQQAIDDIDQRFLVVVAARLGLPPSRTLKITTPTGRDNISHFYETTLGQPFEDVPRGTFTVEHQQA